MNTLSIFTPVYNRAYIINKLYESLKRQTSYDFEWIIVDDGSEDNLGELVSNFIKEGIVNIKYIKQSNQGKHIAINKGIRNADSVLFFIVDSDDSLKDNAVETIINFWNQYVKKHNLSSISGIISYRVFPSGKLVGNKLPSYVTKCKLRECVSKYHSRGDKVVIYRTEIFKQYRYPKFENEKFLGESYVFNQIDDCYDMLVMDEALYVFDYQSDGLSQKFRKLYRDNPIGFLACYEQQASLVTSKKQLHKVAAHIVCLSLKTKSFIKTLKMSYNIISPYSLIGGLYLYFKIFIFKSNDVKPYYGSDD